MLTTFVQFIVEQVTCITHGLMLHFIFSSEAIVFALAYNSLLVLYYIMLPGLTLIPFSKFL